MILHLPAAFIPCSNTTSQGQMEEGLEPKRRKINEKKPCDICIVKCNAKSQGHRTITTLAPLMRSVPMEDTRMVEEMQHQYSAWRRGCMNDSIVLRKGWKTVRGGDNRTPNLLVTGLSERACKPLQTFIKTISGSSTSGLDIPGTLSQAV